MNDDTTAPPGPASSPVVTLTCPRCATSFASLAELYDHRLAPVANGRTGQPCQPRAGIGVGSGQQNSPAPVVYDLGPVHAHSWLCPDMGPSGIGDSRGPVLVLARVAVVVNAEAVAA